MKISNIKDKNKFMETIKKCKGRVELVTQEGDRLNLKSTLCQYIALTNIFKDSIIGDVELMFSEPSDANLMLDFLIKGD